MFVSLPWGSSCSGNLITTEPLVLQYLWRKIGHCLDIHPSSFYSSTSFKIGTPYQLILGSVSYRFGRTSCVVHSIISYLQVLSFSYVISTEILKSCMFAIWVWFQSNKSRFSAAWLSMIPVSPANICFRCTIEYAFWRIEFPFFPGYLSRCFQSPSVFSFLAIT